MVAIGWLFNLKGMYGKEQSSLDQVNLLIQCGTKHFSAAQQVTCKTELNLTQRFGTQKGQLNMKTELPDLFFLL